jgi:hypothetical protein
MRGQRGDHFRWSLCARSKRAPGTFEAELELIHILHIHVHHLHIYIIHIHIIQIIYIYIFIYLFTITYLYWFVEMRSPHWGPCFSTCTGGLEGSFHAERVGKGGKGCLVWAHWSPEMPRICTLKQGPWGLLPFCSVKNWGFESLRSFSKLLEVTRFFDKAFFWPLSKLFAAVEADSCDSWVLFAKRACHVQRFGQCNTRQVTALALTQGFQSKHRKSKVSTSFKKMWTTCSFFWLVFGPIGWWTRKLSARIWVSSADSLDFWPLTVSMQMKAFETRPQVLTKCWILIQKTPHSRWLSIVLQNFGILFAKSCLALRDFRRFQLFALLAAGSLCISMFVDLKGVHMLYVSSWCNRFQRAIRDRMVQSDFCPISTGRRPCSRFSCGTFRCVACKPLRWRLAE